MVPTAQVLYRVRLPLFWEGLQDRQAPLPISVGHPPQVDSAVRHLLHSVLRGNYRAIQSHVTRDISLDGGSQRDNS